MKNYNHSKHVISRACGLSRHDLRYFNDMIHGIMIDAGTTSQLTEKLENRLKAGAPLELRLFALYLAFNLITKEQKEVLK